MKTDTDFREILKARSPDPLAKIVVSYGGGKNSTAMLIFMQKLGIKPDIILFADTGGELPETYEYIDKFSDWLVGNGFPPITITRRTPTKVTERRKPLQSLKEPFQYLLRRSANTNAIALFLWLRGVAHSQATTLEEACLIYQTMPSAAYGKKACSFQWKIEPQDEYIKELGWLESDLKIRKMIGFHSGEQSRMISKKTGDLFLEDEHYSYEYPLVQYGIDERLCRILIASTGLAVPPKSSCFFCPNRRLEEVTTLPEELKLRGDLIEAVAERGVHFRESSTKGLGRKFRWQDIELLSDLEKSGIDYQLANRSCGCVEMGVDA